MIGSEKVVSDKFSCEVSKMMKDMICFFNGKDCAKDKCPLWDEASGDYPAECGMAYTMRSIEHCIHAIHETVEQLFAVNEFRGMQIDEDEDEIVRGDAPHGSCHTICPSSKGRGS